MKDKLIAVGSDELLEGVQYDSSLDFKDGEISRLGKRICRELQSLDSLSSIVLEAPANELPVYSARSLDKSDKPPAWLKTAHELIKDGCAKSITIAEIAAPVGVHPLHLARTFRRFFNCSPGEYLRKCRIELASNLLLNSKKTLVEIALISGFADQSQFTQSFKNSTGITPAKLVAKRLRQCGLQRILFASDRSPGFGNESPKDAWDAFRRPPLTEKEFRTVAENVAP